MWGVISIVLFVVYHLWRGWALPQSFMLQYFIGFGFWFFALQANGVSFMLWFALMVTAVVCIFGASAVHGIIRGWREGRNEVWLP